MYRGMDNFAGVERSRHRTFSFCTLGAGPLADIFRTIFALGSCPNKPKHFGVFCSDFRVDSNSNGFFVGFPSWPLFFMLSVDLDSTFPTLGFFSADGAFENALFTGDEETWLAGVGLTAGFFAGSCFTGASSNFDGVAELKNKFFALSGLAVLVSPSDLALQVRGVGNGDEIVEGVVTECGVDG